MLEATATIANIKHILPRVIPAMKISRNPYSPS
jgi:hypothetical protein